MINGKHIKKTSYETGLFLNKTDWDLSHSANPEPIFFVGNFTGVAYTPVKSEAQVGHPLNPLGS